MSTHHATIREITPGLWDIAQPVRATGWWFRRRYERSCRINIGHCWHPTGMIDWWCCECGSETDGMPPQNCRLCKAGS